MNTESLKSGLRKFFFLTATSLLLVAGLTAEAMAQRGGARGAGAGGAVRPTISPSRPIVVVPREPRRSDFPMPTRVRRMPDIERGDDVAGELERRKHERREREPRDDNTRRDVPRRQDDDGNRFQKLGRWLGVSPERLQQYYLQAKATNPDLRLSQFFGALVIANRFAGSNSNITAQAILRGLDAGMSMERTLVALGLTAEDAKATVKWAERVANHLKP